MNKVINFCSQVRQLPEKVITQTKKYKFLQSKFSILYNEATQLRLSWDEVQKQMQFLKSSFNAAQETSEVIPLIYSFNCCFLFNICY